VKAIVCAALLMGCAGKLEHENPCYWNAAGEAEDGCERSEPVCHRFGLRGQPGGTIWFCDSAKESPGCNVVGPRYVEGVATGETVQLCPEPELAIPATECVEFSGPIEVNGGRHDGVSVWKGPLVVTLLGGVETYRTAAENCIAFGAGEGSW
jgi:hypothetical protein